MNNKQHYIRFLCWNKWFYPRSSRIPLSRFLRSLSAAAVIEDSQMKLISSDKRLPCYSSHICRVNEALLPAVHLQGAIQCHSGLLFYAVKSDCICFSSIVLMCGNLGGKYDRSDLSILLIKSKAVFLFVFLFHQKCHKHWSRRYFLFRIKMASYTPLYAI